MESADRKRKAHRKSRKGCTACKRRHIKCDEQRPQCGRCQRLDITCVFEPECDTSKHSSPAGISDIPGSSKSCDLPMGLNFLDLELMHHYSTDTYTTLEGTVENLDLIRNNLVNLALRHAYLMHALLAISALHLHHQDSSRCSLQLAAVEHFDNGLRLARDAMDECTQDHPIALFIFSSMAATYVLAKDSRSLPLNSGLESNPLDDFIRYFHLVRGVRTIVEVHWDFLQNSWAQPFFEDHFIHSSPQAQAHDHPQMTNLLELVCGLENTNHSRIYTHALERLLAYMAALKTGPEASADARLLLVWLAEVEDGYLSLVSSKAPIALIILAYYAVLVNMRPYVWWTAGWPRRILTSIVDTLPREWLPYVQWPLDILSSSDNDIIDYTVVDANAST